MTDDGSRQIESYLSIGSYIFNTRAFEFLNRQSIFFSFLREGGPRAHKQMHATRESFLSIFLGVGGPKGRKHTTCCVNHFLREN